MAVTVSAGPRIFPMANADPRLPQAWWAGTVRATGDASGGNLVATITLPLSGLFSFEEVFPAMNATVNMEVTIDSGVEMAGVGGDRIVWGYRVRFVAVDTGNFQAEPVDHQLMRLPPIFQPQTPPTIICSVLNLAGRQNINRCWGYWWGQEALKYEGGPLRPWAALAPIILAPDPETRLEPAGARLRAGFGRTPLFRPLGGGD